MKLLRDVDGDEISLVNRAANRRRFLLLKEDGVNGDLSEILDQPYEHEGALLDAIRKDGVANEDVEKAFIAAIRLLKGVEGEFSPELVAKLGTELYPVSNPPLNTSPGIAASFDLHGRGYSSEDDPPESDDEAGSDNPGSASGGSLTGHGSGAKVAADRPWDDDEDDADVEKRDFSADERRSAASSGNAMPDGSFPIKNASDLKNAIHLAGNAKNPGKARAFIRRKAKAMGLSSAIPDTWGVSKEDVEKEDVVDEGERGTVETRVVPIQKEDGTWDFTDVPDESAAFFRAMIQKQDETVQQLEDARSKVQKAEDDLLHRTMIEKSARLSHVAAPDELAPVLKEASEKLEPETFEKLHDLLAKAETLIAQGDVFKEYGAAARPQGSDPSGQDAESKLDEIAKGYVEKSGDLGYHEAYNRAITENPDLYQKYMFEHGMGV